MNIHGFLFKRELVIFYLIQRCEPSTLKKSKHKSISSACSLAYDLDSTEPILTITFINRLRLQVSTRVPLSYHADIA